MRLRRGSAALMLVAAVTALAVVGCAKVAGSVNGEKIYMSKVDEQLAQMQGQQSAFQGKEGKKLEKQFKERILDKLIDDALVMQEADKMGVKPTDKEINERYEQLKKQFPSEAQFNDALQKAKLTPDKLKESIAQQLVMQKLTTKVSKTKTVSDKEIAAYYKSNKAQFADPEKYSVVQILVKTKDKALAEKLYKQLKGGANFAALAKKYSTDPGSKNKGGDLGYMSPGEVVPEFGAAMSKAKMNELVKPFKSTYGWHIIKVTGKRPPRTKPLSEVKEQIRQMILQTSQRDAFNKWLANVKKKADIKKYL